MSMISSVMNLAAKHGAGTRAAQSSLDAPAHLAWRSSIVVLSRCNRMHGLTMSLALMDTLSSDWLG